VFTVEWLPLAQDELARIWIYASDRNAVTTAQARADRLLQTDPVGNGQHISEGYYRIHVPPLIISYTIDEDQNQVEVAWVRYRP
jgi:hypothetical protein